MKNILTLFLLLSINNIVNAGQIEDWLYSLENPEWKDFELHKDNMKEKHLHHDFSQLLMPKHDFLGYIQPNYRRLKIIFTSVTKDNNAQDKYLITGYSVVNNNKCDFNGIINIKQIREYKLKQFGLGVNDAEYSNIAARGILIGSYEFKENTNQKYSGLFNGIITLYWYIDKGGNIQYDNLLYHYSDSYKNNQYIGVWSQYNKETSKQANWGEYRIPFSGDLDIGADGFWANPTYSKYGWDDLVFPGRRIK